MKRWFSLLVLALLVPVLPLAHATYPIAWQSRYTDADDAFDGRIANVEIDADGNITVFSGAGYGIALINPRTGHMTPRRLHLRDIILSDGFTDDEGCYVLLGQCPSSQPQAEHDVVFTRLNRNGAELISHRFEPQQPFTDGIPVDLVKLLDGTTAFAFYFTDGESIQPYVAFWDQDSGRLSRVSFYATKLVPLQNGNLLIVDDGSLSGESPRVICLSRSGDLLWAVPISSGPVPFEAAEIEDGQIVFATRDPGGIGWISSDGHFRDWMNLSGTVRAIAQGGPTRENRAVFLMQENGSSTITIGHALYQQVLWTEEVHGVSTHVRSMIDTPDYGYLLNGYPTLNGSDHSNLVRLGGVVPTLALGSNVVLDPDGGTLSLPSLLETGVIPGHLAQIERLLIHETADTVYRSTMQTMWLESFETHELPNVHVQLDADDPDGEYQVVLQVSDMDGVYTQRAVHEFNKLASGFGIVSGGWLPEDHQLLHVYPNPFNGMTTVTLDLTHPMTVSLDVFDLLGREVGQVRSPGMLAAGVHQLDWDASALAAGTYFLRAGIGDRRYTRRIVLLK